MATTKGRKQANGVMRYTAIVRVRSGQTVLRSESKTFGYRSAAATWAKRREVCLLPARVESSTMPVQQK